MDALFAVYDISIHALREEGDDEQAFGYQEAWAISIHALREEGDVVMRIIAAWSMLFLSTPSARRATIRHDHTYQQGLISIHALREEGDQMSNTAYQRAVISIHALREEGDV